MATEIKELLRRAVDHLPDDVTWNDAFVRLYDRVRFEKGLADIREGRVVADSDVDWAQFGLSDED